MKLRILIAALLACVTVMLPMCGCKSTGPTPTKEAIVFYSFKATWDTAYEAYKQTQKLDLQGKLKPGKIEEVNAKWVAFNASFRLAFIAASKNWDAATPADVLKLRDDLLNLIRSL